LRREREIVASDLATLAIVGGPAPPVATGS